MTKWIFTGLNFEGPQSLNDERNWVDENGLAGIPEAGDTVSLSEESVAGSLAVDTVDGGGTALGGLVAGSIEANTVEGFSAAGGVITAQEGDGVESGFGGEAIVGRSMTAAPWRAARPSRNRRPAEWGPPAERSS